MKNEEDLSAKEVLLRLFRCFCGKSRGLSNTGFNKLCRQTPKLYTPTFTATDTDIIFAGVASSRKLDFARFLEAMALLADRKFPDSAPLEAFALFLREYLFRIPVNGDEYTRPTWDRLIDDLRGQRDNNIQQILRDQRELY